MTGLLRVLVPASLAVPSLPEGTALVVWRDASDLVAALGNEPVGPCVIVTDGLHADMEAAVAGAVRARAGASIEVRSARWDGETASPVSAACRGVISGFGSAGLLAAVALVASPVPGG